MTKHLNLIPPGEILWIEFMELLGISQNQLARDLDIPPNRIHDIIHGKRGITADTALRLSKYFNTTPEFWLNLQMDYDLRKLRRDCWPQTEGRIRPYSPPAKSIKGKKPLKKPLVA